MSNSEIDKFINEISKLPGIGRRSAQRIGLHLLKNKEKSLSPLLQALNEAKKKIVNCENCGNIDTKSPCYICISNNRDLRTICVVEDVSDLWTFERMGFYNGIYHVLGGSLSAINGIGTDEITIKKLIERIDLQNVTEIILALSTTMEGQTTSHVIADKLENISNLEITRLAQGIPIGGEVHYLDENTLNAAFQYRKKIF